MRWDYQRIIQSRIASDAPCIGIIDMIITSVSGFHGGHVPVLRVLFQLLTQRQHRPRVQLYPDLQPPTRVHTRHWHLLHCQPHSHGATVSDAGSLPALLPPF